MINKNNFKNILNIIIMLLIFIFIGILTIIESIYYVFAIILTIIFIILAFSDNHPDRKQLWSQIVGVPFAFCVAMMIKNILQNIIL